jgi:hypothetical protein
MSSIKSSKKGSESKARILGEKVLMIRTGDHHQRVVPLRDLGWKKNPVRNPQD